MTIVTTAQFLHIYPHCHYPDVWAAGWSRALQRYDITSKYIIAGIFGISGNETGGYSALLPGGLLPAEDMRYSPARARELFPKARANPIDLEDRCRTVPTDKGRRFASWIYGDLYGNGPEATEDGWNYRGRGAIGFTFKSLYSQCGDFIGTDFLNAPDGLSGAEHSPEAAIWFMSILKPTIMPMLMAGDEDSYLAGATQVGWTDPTATRRRIDFRRLALEAFSDAPETQASTFSPTPKNRLLFLGVKPGKDVGDLQRLLISKGDAKGPFYKGTIDDDFGPLTKAAVLAAQHAIFPLNPLEWDGVVGSKTLEGIKKL